jgi:hypothetical protein
MTVRTERRRPILDADIRNLDLLPVRFLLARQAGWSAKRIRKAELEYQLYWQMIRDEPSRAHVPSIDADEFWHHHLQCTAHYVEACRQIFGRLLCHYPFAGTLGREDARQQRRRFEKSQAKLVEMRGVYRQVRKAHR